MRACPLHDLHGAAGDQPFHLAGASVEGPQIHGSTVGRIVAVGNVDRPAGVVPEHSEEVRRPFHRVWGVVDPHRRTDHVEVPMPRRRSRCRVQEDEGRHALTVGGGSDEHRMAETIGDRTLQMHRMLLCIAVLATACRPGSSPAPLAATALDVNATMISVVDGDTIDVNIDGHRRTSSTDRDRHAGDEEAQHAGAVLRTGGDQVHQVAARRPDTPLHLERDVVARDDYGRLLAYVYRPTTACSSTWPSCARASPAC